MWIRAGRTFRWRRRRAGVVVVEEVGAEVEVEAAVVGGVMVGMVEVVAEAVVVVG